MLAVDGPFVLLVVGCAVVAFDFVSGAVIVRVSRTSAFRAERLFRCAAGHGVPKCEASVAHGEGDVVSDSDPPVVNVDPFESKQLDSGFGIDFQHGVVQFGIPV